MSDMTWPVIESGDVLSDLFKFVGSVAEHGKFVPSVMGFIRESDDADGSWRDRMALEGCRRVEDGQDGIVAMWTNGKDALIVLPDLHFQDEKQWKLLR